MNLEKHEKAVALANEIKKVKEQLAEWNYIELSLLNDLNVPGTSSINLWNKNKTATRIEMDTSHYFAIRNLHVEKYTITLERLEREFEAL